MDAKSSKQRGEPQMQRMETNITKYVEVPVREKIVKKIPKIVTVEKRVPKEEIEYIEKVVEVPKTQVRETFVESEEILDEIVEIEKLEIIERPKIVHKVGEPRKEVKIVTIEKTVAGPVLERPIPKIVRQKEILPSYTDCEVPVVFCQRVQPILSTDNNLEVEVEVRRYNPKIQYLEVFVPRAVRIPVQPTNAGEPTDQRIMKLAISQEEKISMEVGDEKHAYISRGISSAEFNSWMLACNQHLKDAAALEKLPWARNPDSGRRDFLPAGTPLRGLATAL
eukprot:GHVP01036336.1.p2 GENE.GHVP01036336.1~~GHVP01036336.1.p2  ORF type:complete len:299 (-),score=66.77 GHVP01036336.1:3856-4695(-)